MSQKGCTILIKWTTINVIVELILTLGFHKISTQYLVGFGALQDRKRDKTMLLAADVCHGMKRSFG